MTKDAFETIAAISTAPGFSGIGVIRISGPKTANIAKAVLGHLPKPRYAELLSFYAKDGVVLDQGLALYFPKPHSFTGEDVLELQGHGGPVVLDSLLRRITQLGARLARAGEFSERAFLNDKLDLIQAEAIADLIHSESEQAARAAIRSLQGEFSNRIFHVLEQLTHLRIHVEASIDFAEEDIDLFQHKKIVQEIDNILQTLNEIQKSAKQGALLREGITVALAGKANTGKSSLLNFLTGKDSAIVTNIPGTTRDVLREFIHIDGLPLQIADTAGLRTTEDTVEQEGVRRALKEIEKADRVLLIMDYFLEPVIDFNRLEKEFMHVMERLTIIQNKIDLCEELPSLTQEHGVNVIKLSVKTGEGITLLKKHLKESVGFTPNTEGSFIAKRRHLDALARATEILSASRQQLNENSAYELLAEDLRLTLNTLGEITGKVTTEDLLGKIFSSFCIGK